MNAKCPVCHKQAEVTSIFNFLWVHYCETTDTRWFTDGILWSNDFKQIKGVSREQGNSNPSIGA